MNKKQKLLIGGASVSAVVAGVALTGGTSAFYYDMEQQTGNSIEACDFDLTQSVETVKTTTGVPVTQSTAGSQPGAITISNVEPGDTFRSTITLSNIGSCAGDLWADIDQHSDDENGTLEPEANEGGDDTPGGDLGGYMKVSVLQGATPISGLQDVTLASLATLLPSNVDSTFAGGDTTTLVLEFVAPVNAANPGGRADENKIMTDAYTFELDFALAQQGYMPASPGDLSTLG